MDRRSAAIRTWITAVIVGPDDSFVRAASGVI